MVMDGDGTILGDTTDGITGAGEVMVMDGTALGSGVDMVMQVMATGGMRHYIIMDMEVITVIMAAPIEVMPTTIQDAATIIPMYQETVHQQLLCGEGPMLILEEIPIDIEALPQREVLRIPGALETTVGTAL